MPVQIVLLNKILVSCSSFSGVCVCVVSVGGREGDVGRVDDVAPDLRFKSVSIQIVSPNRILVSYSKFSGVCMWGGGGDSAPDLRLKSSSSVK